MRLITAYELAKLNQRELRILFQQVSTMLNQSAAESPDRLNALASLENIERALCRVFPRP